MDIGSRMVKVLKLNLVKTKPVINEGRKTRSGARDHLSQKGKK
jgi:hypothetical protein